MTRATPATSIGPGIWRRTTTPMSVAAAGGDGRHSGTVARRRSSGARPADRRVYPDQTQSGTVGPRRRAGAVNTGSGRVPPDHRRGLLHREGVDPGGGPARSHPRSVPAVRDDDKLNHPVIAGFVAVAAASGFVSQDILGEKRYRGAAIDA